MLQNDVGYVILAMNFNATIFDEIELFQNKISGVYKE